MSISFITISIFGPANGGHAQSTSALGTPPSIVPFTNLSSIPVFTTPSPEQWSAISRDLASYQISLESNNLDLGPRISSAVPADVVSTIQGLDVPPQATVTSMIAESEVASTAIDIAWLTGNTQGVTTRPWEKYLNPSLRSAAEAQATSIYRAEQSIVRADLQAGTNVLLIPSVKERLLGAVAGTLAMMALWM